MNRNTKNLLVKYKIIDDPFDYEFLDKELVNKYEYFDHKFQILFKEKANQFQLKDCYFYIKNDLTCNAFARCIRGYNIIGITCGYPIQMSDFFDDKYFSSIIAIGLTNELSISNAYTDLYKVENFKFNKFMLDCSIQFTFGHEFQHILQINSSKIASNYKFSENLDSSAFEIQKHIWEFDADRFASFEVLKYIFQINRELKIKSDNVFKCMLFLGLGSLFITKFLFYLNLVNFKQTIKRREFYIKINSHPHPLVRLFNIIDYFYDNIKTMFPNLNIDKQELLNNGLRIVKIHLDSFVTDHEIMTELFNDLDAHLVAINAYNEELYDLAILDNSIRELLISRNINFGQSSQNKVLRTY
jgi:hypothetical protein